jgi:hypothetical protein
MDSLETELAEKLQQLQLLTAENEMLRLRESVLEAAVAGREEVVRYAWGLCQPRMCLAIASRQGMQAVTVCVCIVCCELTMPLHKPPRLEYMLSHYVCRCV